MYFACSVKLYYLLKMKKATQFSMNVAENACNTNKRLNTHSTLFIKTACMPKQIPKALTTTVKQIKKRIDVNPINGHNTAILASDAGISRNVLQEVFKAQYGTSIGQYKLQLRMAAAKKQLTSGKSIKEVSIILQYSSPSSFCNAFRNFFEVSPTEWLQTQ